MTHLIASNRRVANWCVAIRTRIAYSDLFVFGPYLFRWLEFFAAVWAFQQHSFGSLCCLMNFTAIF